MKLLLIGSGGREHALAWRFLQDDPTIEIFAAPGNPGIAELGTCVSIPATDIDRLITFARAESIELVVVGPEAPLAEGIVDAFRETGIPIFGPTRAAAMIEASKAFSKALMAEAGVPSAASIACDNLADAMEAIERFGAPVVIKASGLAAGKGVVICASTNDARATAAAMLEDQLFGEAGRTILIEEFMEGEELSMFVLTDGERAIPLLPAQDHKRLLDGDRGPNTGGMGAYAPVSIVEQSPGLVDTVLAEIVHPTLGALRARGTPFTGLLYVGLMLTVDGPKVVEFNCRFGDPETEAVLPAMSSSPSLLDLVGIVARGEQLPEQVEMQISGYAVTTVLAAAGYPEAPRLGDRIEIPPIPEDVLVFHAGTKRAPDGSLVTAGGRVLAITGVGDSFEEAQQRSATIASSITFEGKQFRSDIGWREVTRLA